ncbi:MAG: DNA-3-methyladenine glycosylase 2 family protein [Opitutaceae bacterium]|nr:DNA-3-methyladenine glycosylase 2 family protein [Opitutaceae bacterium]
MRLSHAAMYARLLESDASCNGRFFTGVLTTGIYCLPACRARKPKPENVRFFPTCEAARAAGLRPCRKCHPDDFARGADPVLADIETLVAAIRSAPQDFPDVQAVVRRSGFGTTRLFELVRQHFQTTPAELLLRARIDAAKRRLVAGNEGLARLAGEAGFESLSVFHVHFRRLTGLTPAEYRALRGSQSFTLKLPAEYPLAYLRRALTRDPQSLTERSDGDHFTLGLRSGETPAMIELTLLPGALAVKATGISALAAHGTVVSLLGLDQDAAAFSRLARRLGLARLVAGRTGLRVVQTPSLFDGLLWSILGQQINFAFACVLKRRLVERAGTPLADGLYAPPTPSAVAALAPADLAPLQFSRAKAEYLLSTARLVSEGRLDLEALRAHSATRVERTLLAVRGLGPWSVNYLMMRALGWPDCVPWGDTGVTSGLQALLKLETRPDLGATRRLMSVFAPYRSLATAHLWQFNRPLPT